MVCIAAFIILALLGVFAMVISIFKPDFGRRYLAMLKESWGCVAKRATLQKCETGFGDEVKNNILSRVVLRNPKLVKPISALIEISSIAIVLVSAWSLVEASKAGLALWTLGTCNVKHASACTLGAEVCSIDDNTEPQNLLDHAKLWFSDWGEIFKAVPDKFRSWDVENFQAEYIAAGLNQSSEQVLDIFDPGCSVCAQSFKAQLESGFFADHSVRFVVYPIKDESGKLKFKNSELIARYLYAIDQYGSGKSSKLSVAEIEMAILTRVFTEKNDANHAWQGVFNDELSSDEAEVILQSWLKELGGYHTKERAAIAELAMSEEITAKLTANDHFVKEEIHAKGIPTMIYGGRKHTGRFEQ